MAHTLTTQVIVNGRKATIIKITIKGDGASGELNKAILFDASAYLTASVANKIMEIEYCLNGFSAELFWDATTDVPAISLANGYPTHHKFWDVGGLVNNGAAANVTGDILISTLGLAATAYSGHIILYLMEREVPNHGTF